MSPPDTVPDLRCHRTGGVAFPPACLGRQRKRRLRRQPERGRGYGPVARGCGARARCRNGYIRFMTSRRPVRHDPVERMNQVALSQQGIDSEYWPDSDLAALAGHDNLGWWIEHLREAEASIRGTGNG